MQNASGTHFSGLWSQKVEATPPSPTSILQQDQIATILAVNNPSSIAISSKQSIGNMNHSPFPGFPAIYQSSEDVNATDDTCNHPDQVENKPIRLRYPRYPDKLYDDKEAYGRSLTFNEGGSICLKRISSTGPPLTYR